jgi:hypothetical protein
MKSNLNSQTTEPDLVLGTYPIDEQGRIRINFHLQFSIAK